MTVGVKIHRPDPEKPGLAVCGRKAAPDRTSETPSAVTCVVCRTFAPEHPAGSGTVLDRLVEPDVEVGRGRLSDDDLSRARGRARARAMARVATQHPETFRTVYRDELLQAIAEAEELDFLAVV